MSYMKVLVGDLSTSWSLANSRPQRTRRLSISDRFGRAMSAIGAVQVVVGYELLTGLRLQSLSTVFAIRV
jgi:hypothetical protein